MEARVLHIEGKVKKSDLDLAHLDDFRCRAGTTVDARTILDRPEVTLYCLDDSNRQAVFVETLPDVDLGEKPFYFLMQYKNAQRLLTTPYDVLHQLAEVMGDRFTTLVPTYSVGRSGGTLVSRAMNRLDTVLSLDEPDVYNNIALLRPPDGSRDQELTQLLHSCTRLLHKPAKAGVNTLFVKFRATSIEIGDLMYRAFPASKGMFLYRNAEAWAASAHRTMESVAESREGRIGRESDLTGDFFNLFNISKSPEGPDVLKLRRRGPRRKGERPSEKLELLGRVFPLLPPFIKRELKSQIKGIDVFRLIFLMFAENVPKLRNHCRTPSEFLAPYVQAIPPMKLLGLLWLSTMHAYLSLVAKGIPMLAVPYETLVSSPQAALRAIFEYCGLPVEQAAVAEGAFVEDSQSGTPLSRDRLGKRRELSPELLAQLKEILLEHPPIQTPDYVLPNSLVLWTGTAGKMES